MQDSLSQKVSFGEKIGYSLGDAAANLVFQMMMIFQLKFYTDVFGLDGAVAGTILMLGSFSAVIVDPVMGILVDRTQTRWGKFRPWIIWTAIPFCVFYILAFYNPGIHEKAMVAAYAMLNVVWFFAWHFAASRFVGLRFVDLVRDTLPFLLLAAVPTILVFFVTTDIAVLWLRLALRVALVAAAYFLLLYFAQAQILREALQFIKRKG